MAVLVRLFDFTPNTLIQSAQVDSEFQQLVDILSGVSTTKEAVIKLSHAATPPLTLDQLGAGVIQSWKQAGAELARVNNNGSILVAGIEISASAPAITFTDQGTEDFSIAVDADALTINGITGPVTFMTFRGGANDDIQVGVPLVVSSGNLRATRPRFTTSIDDSNGNELLVVTATGSAINEFTLANAASGNHPKLSASGGGTNINIDVQPKGAANFRGLFSIGQGFVAQAIGATDAPFNGFANSSGTISGGFGYALATANFSNVADTNDIILRSGSSSGAAGHLILCAMSAKDIKFATGSNDASSQNDTLKAILKTTGEFGINRATPGAQLGVTANATNQIGLIVNNPSGTSVDIAQFKTNDVTQLTIKNNGHIIGVPKCVHTNSNATGTVTTGLDSLHSFSLPAGSLANNGDYVRARYAGTFATNDNDKRIVISFAGQTVHDPGLFDQDAGSWSYDIEYLRVSDTSIRFSVLAVWYFIAVDGAQALGGSNGFIIGVSGTITVADLDVNASTMLVQAESNETAGAGTGTNSIVQNFSVIELTQNT